MRRAKTWIRSGILPASSEDGGPGAHEFGTAKFVLRSVASGLGVLLACGHRRGRAHEIGTTNFVFGGCS